VLAGMHESPSHCVFSPAHEEDHWHFFYRNILDEFEGVPPFLFIRTRRAQQIGIFLTLLLFFFGRILRKRCGRHVPTAKAPLKLPKVAVYLLMETSAIALAKGSGIVRKFLSM